MIPTMTRTLKVPVNKYRELAEKGCVTTTVGTGRELEVMLVTFGTGHVTPTIVYCAGSLTGNLKAVQSDNLVSLPVQYTLLM